MLNRKYISVKFSESKLTERSRELSILLDISSFLSTSLNLEEVLDGAISKVLEHFGYDAGRIYLTEEDGKSLRLVACKGIAPKGLEKVSMDGSFSGKAVCAKCFVAQHVSELDDKERATLLSRRGFKIVICVPLVAMDQVIGAMNLATKKVIELHQEEIDLLIATANQIAAAVNNARIYEQLEKKVQKIKEKTDTIKFFAYSASHDLKSPAIGVHGLTRLLHKEYADCLDKKGKQYCEQILESAAYIEALVGQINVYVQARETPLNIETIRVGEIIAVVRNQFSDVLEKRHIKWSEPETNPEIMADRLSITRVFQNLVDNALKYGGRGLTEIGIGYSEDSEHHIFSVSNDGPGIEQEHSQKIFEPFQRKTVGEGPQGAGMGLAIVREIAQRHGGKVWMESEPEKTTTFYVATLKKL
ncbi:MAG: GAF domain-containing sensor histidine kinase [Pseudomonadota bacterium]